MQPTTANAVAGIGTPNSAKSRSHRSDDAADDDRRDHRHDDRLRESRARSRRRDRTGRRRRHRAASPGRNSIRLPPSPSRPRARSRAGIVTRLGARAARAFGVDCHRTTSCAACSGAWSAVTDAVAVRGDGERQSRRNDDTRHLDHGPASCSWAADSLNNATVGREFPPDRESLGASECRGTAARSARSRVSNEIGCRTPSRCGSLSALHCRDTRRASLVVPSLLAFGRRLSQVRRGRDRAATRLCRLDASSLEVPAQLADQATAESR